MEYIKKFGDVYATPIRYYECDTEADKNSIDTSELEIGTRVFVIANGLSYVLNSAKQWIGLGLYD